ncbi:MAG: SPFH domain-containing protein [Anaerolineae bacterium]|jgi:regulator of protease activity HflC (stomatin/prohibitin superfamily)
MAAQKPFTLDEGLSDRTDSLWMIYLFYLPLFLMALLIPLLVLALLFPHPVTSWLLALGLALLITDFVLFFLMAIGLKDRRGVAIIGLLMPTILWLVGVFAMVPRPLSLKLTLLVVETLLFGLAFLIGLFLLGGFLLPFPPPDRSLSRPERFRRRLGEHLQVFKILLDVLLEQNYPFWVVTDEPREEDKIEQRGKGDALPTIPPFGTGIILSGCTHAVAVSNGLQFKGTQGPGLFFTGFAERPMRTLDLRPQLRAFTVQGLTRDGIQVNVRAFTPFQIDRGEQPPRLGAPFPYRKSAAFRAVHAQMMALAGSPDHPQHAWDELPQLYGTRILQDILARYDFDDLYRYDPGEEPPRVRIAREFRERLRAELEPYGIQLIGGGISNLMPVREEVLKERVRNWRAEWVRRILVQQAEGQRERLWRIEQARAEAQAHLILTLGEQLAELDRPDTPVTPQKIVDQFLKILEEMTQQPMMRRYLPRETPEDLRRLGAGITTEKQG